jgi:arylsulfatase A-like enzyme/Tfp pilus assembly protein PilF
VAVRRVLLILGLLVACARKPVEPSNVLLITVDTLRPDALGWVAHRNATPAIDALAKEGFRFPAAVAPAPLTFPSHAALHTGFLPRRLGLRDNGQLLGATPATLAEIFKQRGYATAAFVSGYPLASEFGLDRGFDHYDDHLTSSLDEPERPADATARATMQWMRSASPPWFVWVHFYDPHFPYVGSYAEEVARVDRAIGELRSSLNENTLTVFAADHGESLGEHGEGTHGFFIYDSTILVPLIFHFTGRIAPGESRAAARLIDVAPTLLELLELPPLAESDGVSLRATLRGDRQSIPEAYIETYQPWTSYGWSPLHGVRDQGWKLIAAPRPELYDLRADSTESRNVFDADHHQVRALERVRRAAMALPSKVAAGTADAEALAKLRALGYIGAGAGSSEPPARGLRDPKDGAELRELLTRGDVALRANQPHEALPHFESVLGEDPENRFALMRSATALLALDRTDDAAKRLEVAVRLDPERAEARALLADALLKIGQPQRAADHAMELVRLQPRSAVAWVKLGTALGLSRRFDDAIDAFRRAVELEPDDPRWLARLAFAEHAAGRRDAAARSLLALAKLTGEQRFSYAGALGILLAQEGRYDEARVWLARSRPEEADYPDARFELAALEAARGNHESARRALRDALSAAPALRERAGRDPRLAPLLP